MLTFIPKENLETLKHYKYNGGDATTIDKIFNIFWNWCLKFLPTSLHPNMVTLIGGFCLLFSSSLFFLFSSNPLIDNCPSVLYFIQYTFS